MNYLCTGKSLARIALIISIWLVGIPASAQDAGETNPEESAEVQRQLTEAAREAQEGIDLAAREAEERLTAAVAAAEQRANWGWLGLLGLLGLAGLRRPRA